MAGDELDVALARLRADYPIEPGGLDIDDLPGDPVAAFRGWLTEAVVAAAPEPNAMTLATVDEQSRPAARTVLLKGVDERGFVFYSNYASRKAQELAANPHAALVFTWLGLHRQVRVRGTTERIDAAESDAYFATRPLDSQLGAAASPQSQVIADRRALDDRMAELRARYAGGPVPRPEQWGGYRVVPYEIEFWQGHRDRLHDRVRFRREGTGWVTERLAP